MNVKGQILNQRYPHILSTNKQSPVLHTLIEGKNNPKKYFSLPNWKFDDNNKWPRAAYLNTKVDLLGKCQPIFKNNLYNDIFYTI